MKTMNNNKLYIYIKNIIITTTISRIVIVMMNIITHNNRYNLTIFLWIQLYLLRKWDWGLMTRGLAVASQKVFASIGIV